MRLDRLGPPYPALPPHRRSGTVMVAPLRYGDAQLTQMLDDGWYHLPTRWRLDSHRPTHLAPYEKGERAAIRHLWTIEGWERVDDDRIAREARFGGRRSGRTPPYWRVQLGPHSILDPSIEGYDWGPRGPMFVPLEVFDLAESVFLLRGDVRHIELLRVLHHLREGARSWEPGWKVREPLVLDGGSRVGQATPGPAPGKASRAFLGVPRPNGMHPCRRAPPGGPPRPARCCLGESSTHRLPERADRCPVRRPRRA